MMVLVIDEFRDWLNSKTPDYCVGQAGQPNCCPIATYLHEKTQTTHTVGNSTYRKGRDGVVKIEDLAGLPTWASAFIIEIDHSFIASYVSAQQAHEILNRVTTEIERK